MDRRVAAFFRTDGPGAAGIAGLRGGGVVFAFAKSGADGMDRRQIEDVETEARDVVEARLNVFEGSVVTAGAKGCVVFSSEAVRDYRGFLAVDDSLSHAHWLFQHNGAVFLLKDILQRLVPHRRTERHGGAQVAGGVVGAMRTLPIVLHGEPASDCCLCCPWLLRWHRGISRPRSRYLR